MKAKFFILASALLAVSLVGCKNNDPAVPNPADETTSLVLQLPEELLAQAKETRAIEEPQAQGKTKIDDITVFLMIGETKYIAHSHLPGDFDQGYYRYEDVPGNVNNVIVVINKVGEAIENLTTASTIRNYAYTVASQHQKSKLEGRTLMGEAVPQPATDPNARPGKTYKLANVDMHALTSRIEVGPIKAGTGLTSIRLVAVYVNNYFPTYGTTTVVKNTGGVLANWGVNYSKPGQVAGVGYKEAIGTFTINQNAYTEPKYVDAADNAQVKVAPDTKAYSYHVFSGNVPHVILLVQGVYADGYCKVEGADKFNNFYGWVTFTKFKRANNTYIDAFEPNKIYKMGIPDGITINYDDVYPEPEMSPFDLGLQVEVLDWIPENVTPEL